MEYSYYLLEGNGLNDTMVMEAIRRARRRFFLRPGYVARHLTDMVRLSATKPTVAWRFVSQALFRSPGGGAPQSPAALPHATPASHLGDDAVDVTGR
jgi:hypothetical protein